MTVPSAGDRVVADADEMRALGAELAALVRPGDVVVLSGPLGAGKTTWVQGFAEALGVRGPITSPTFVIARTHPSLVGGPALLHVDAYRVNSVIDFDDLDLVDDRESAVTVVEWGDEVTEALGDDRLDVTIVRTSQGEDADGPRQVIWAGRGPRWLLG